MSPKFISCEVGSERMTREDIKKTLCQPPVGLDTIRQFLLSRGRIFPTVKSYFRCCAIFPLSRAPARGKTSSLINEVSSDIPFSRLSNLIKATELNARMLSSPANRWKIHECCKERHRLSGFSLITSPVLYVPPCVKLPSEITLNIPQECLVRENFFYQRIFKFLPH